MCGTLPWPELVPVVGRRTVLGPDMAAAAAAPGRTQEAHGKHTGSTRVHQRHGDDQTSNDRYNHNSIYQENYKQNKDYINHNNHENHIRHKNYKPNKNCINHNDNKNQYTSNTRTSAH